MVELCGSVLPELLQLLPERFDHLVVAFVHQVDAGFAVGRYHRAESLNPVRVIGVEVALFRLMDLHEVHIAIIVIATATTVAPREIGFVARAASSQLSAAAASARIDTSTSSDSPPRPTAAIILASSS